MEQLCVPRAQAEMEASKALASLAATLFEPFVEGNLKRGEECQAAAINAVVSSYSWRASKCLGRPLPVLSKILLDALRAADDGVNIELDDALGNIVPLEEMVEIVQHVGTATQHVKDEMTAANSVKVRKKEEGRRIYVTFSSMCKMTANSVKVTSLFRIRVYSLFSLPMVG